MTIYHLADPDEWAQALVAGEYTRSTRGRSLADEGFIHCSDDHQWPVVRRAFYGDLTGPLLLLEVDERRLTSPVVREVGNPATGEVFAHVYGPLDLAAVVGTTELPPPHA